MREFRYRRRWVLGAGVALAGVLLASLVHGTGREPGTVTLVRGYFEAIGEHDVARALRTAKIDRPDGEEARFLAAGALGDWKVGEVTETSNSGYTDDAEVTVVLVGEHHRRYKTTVRLLKSRAGLRIAEPLATVRFGVTAMRYVEVGGVRAPFQVDPANKDRSVEYRLFPGLYRFYQGRQDVVRVAAGQTPVFPGDGGTVSGGVPVSPEFTVTPAGERAVSQAYNAFIDRCAKARGLPAAGCPFGPDPVGAIRTRDRDVSGFRKLTWRVLKYPAVAVLAQGSGLEIVDRERGTVELKGTGVVDGSGPRRAFTVPCETITDATYGTLAMDGTVSIAVPRNGLRKDTCRDGALAAR
ncbi:MAG TPA: hypothetical protein VFV01_03865 [Spirillospora sp.]|nr:hypothetical protein [Spirillospora sp.]